MASRNLPIPFNFSCWDIHPWPDHASQTIFVEKADTACDGAEAWPGKNKALCLSAGSIVQQEGSFSGLIIAATFLQGVPEKDAL